MLDDRVVSCSLPHVGDDAAVPFAVYGSGTDPFSQYILDLFNGNKPALPMVGSLKGTPFQRKIWKGLMTIPWGDTRTYGQLAQELDCERSCRALANACGRNPAPLFVPCHRVVGAHGGLGGFSSGLAWKRLLLGLERSARI